MSTPMHILTRDDDVPNCGSGGGADTFFGLRVASIFIILVGSTFGALFPVLAKNSSWLHVPKSVFEYVLRIMNLTNLLLIVCAASRNILEAVSLCVSVMVASRRNKRMNQLFLFFLF